MFLKDALPSMLRRRIQDEGARLEHFTSLTRLVGPANILKRGYALLEWGGGFFLCPAACPDRPLFVRTAEADITRIETIASHDGKLTYEQAFAELKASLKRSKTKDRRGRRAGGESQTRQLPHQVLPGQTARHGKRSEYDHPADGGEGWRGGPEKQGESEQCFSLFHCSCFSHFALILKLRCEKQKPCE